MNYSRNAILHDELRDSEQNAINDAGVIAHELAHQFFGNLLTSDWWNELWLNEGGSVLFESPIIVKVYANVYILHSNMAISSFQSITLVV